MPIAPDAAPLDHIIELANGVIDACPSCAGTASEIVMWASEIRERRPGREQLAALVDACHLSRPAGRSEDAADRRFAGLCSLRRDLNRSTEQILDRDVSALGWMVQSPIMTTSGP
ncbi:hypothetical protein [Microvirga sp. VF16]|uniref:hypothetical protein n=1 Tax=Microvirga sp. VF16 TaxID=2807101 RepID=UPI001FED7B28|nr:hypothetical protein [Microvirga sp. VF16]